MVFFELSYLLFCYEDLRTELGKFLQKYGALVIQNFLEFQLTGPQEIGELVGGGGRGDSSDDPIFICSSEKAFISKAKFVLSV